MKRIVLILGITGSLMFVSCKDNASDKVKAENVEIASQRDEASKDLPIMTFEEKEFDFGNIKQGTPVEHVFTFKNTGTAPLVITNATSSCGCTVPERPEGPIAPGETGELLVKFNGSGKNQVMKTITITANTATGTEQLRIKAFVEATDDAAPMQASH